jgi:hypothetical protein
MTEETKHEKFIRLRDTRLPKIVHALDLFSNLASPSYESSTEEAEELLQELQDAVDKVAEAFSLVPHPARRPDPEDDDLDIDPELADRAALKAQAGEREEDDDPLDRFEELRDVPRPWVQNWDDLKLIDVGARLGLALEACMDFDADTARKHLVDVMRT